MAKREEQGETKEKSGEGSGRDSILGSGWGRQGGADMAKANVG